MALLLRDEIERGVNDGTIIIKPYNSEQLNPNSYDVCLSDTLVVYTDKILDVKKNNKTKTITIPSEGYVLKPNELYLGSSIENAGSDYYVTGYDGKSSCARLGVCSHLSADLGIAASRGNGPSKSPSSYQPAYTQE